MIENEKWKIIFRIKYDLYEYMMMFFELINVLSIFQHFINDVLREYLNVFCIAYIDDILIYNNNKKNYIKHVNKFYKDLKTRACKSTSINSNFTKQKSYI